MKYNYRSLAAMLLSMLGFSTACDKAGNIIDDVEMYGCPSADYEVSGEVTDEDGNPIKGIRVAVDWTEGVDDYNLRHKDTVYTNSSGVYESRLDRYLAIKPESLSLVFEDVDGEDNGTFEKSFDSSLVFDVVTCVNRRTISHLDEIRD